MFRLGNTDTGHAAETQPWLDSLGDRIWCLLFIVISGSTFLASLFEITGRMGWAYPFSWVCQNYLCSR